MRFIRFALILFCALFWGKLFAQQHNFYQYSVNDGLIQSQATGITQDQHGHIWIGTEGGVSRYDGRNFLHFTEAEGLISNIVFTVAVDAQNRVWFGTNQGISCFNAKKFINIKLPGPPAIVKQVISKSGRTYVLSGSKLYDLSSMKPILVNIDGRNDLKITSVSFSPDDALICGTVNAGVFMLKNGRWTNIPYPVKGKPWVTGKMLWIGSQALVATNHGIYKLENNKMDYFGAADIQQKTPVITSGMSRDPDGNIWIAVASGVVMRTPRGEVTFFNGSNGYTDNRTTQIFTDRDGNTWFGTDGQGVFRYSGNAFSFYNEESGLPNSIVMSVTRGRDRIWAGTYGGGIVSVRNGIFQRHPFPTKDAGTNQVMSTVEDDQGKLWIGTFTGGILSYDGKRFKILDNNVEIEKKAAVGEMLYHKGRVWVASSKGYGFIANNRIQWVRPNDFAWGFAPAGNNLLVSTATGILLLNETGVIRKASELPLLQKTQIVAMMRDRKGNYWLETNGQGIIIWNLEKDRVLRTITKKDGLSSNVIYSLLETEKDGIWAGTGYGLNNILVDENYQVLRVKQYGKPEGMTGMEANKNALIAAGDGTVYYGTTNGLFIHKPGTDTGEERVREVVLQQIKLFGKPFSDTSVTPSVRWYSVPEKLALKYDQNNITFDFLAVSFTAPNAIQYQFKLDGADNKWQEPTTVGTVNYAALQAGDYTFNVRARIGNGPWSPVTRYNFVLASPFYQTWSFRIFAVLGLILLGVVIRMIGTAAKQKRLYRLEQIRAEEQRKVRQKTAEDFHDEMGNKLTRISLLADILKSKLDEKETDALKITNQIQGNARELYSGTKDIIWSLDPSSDNLLSILGRLQTFGEELFQDTAVRFGMIGLEDRFAAINLPLDYSRNMIMIFKEAMHNVLKYANSTSVSLSVQLTNDPGTDAVQLSLVLADNGLGFDPENIKKGNGINNMNIRAGRINGRLRVHSRKGDGTKVTLEVNIPHTA